ncbi:Hypothetical predicted protein, partial [Pelobates cultripes]
MSEEVSLRTQWAAHKTVVRGVLIQIGSRKKRKTDEETRRITHELTEVDKLNKSNPSTKLAKKVARLQRDLNALSLQTIERRMRALKSTYYTQGNRAGKLLANKLKAQRLQSKIPYIESPQASKLYNPTDIVNALASFYSNLYNLKNDSSVPQPTHAVIDEFLHQ